MRQARWLGKTIRKGDWDGTKLEARVLRTRWRDDRAHWIARRLPLRWRHWAIVTEFAYLTCEVDPTLNANDVSAFELLQSSLDRTKEPGIISRHLDRTKVTADA